MCYNKDIMTEQISTNTQEAEQFTPGEVADTIMVHYLEANQLVIKNGSRARVAVGRVGIRIGRDGIITWGELSSGIEEIGRRTQEGNQIPSYRDEKPQPKDWLQRQHPDA